MKIALFSVVLNIHQVHIADALYELTGHNFVYVELEKPVGLNNKGGTVNFSSKPYLLQAWKNSENEAKAMEIACSADVAIFGGYMALKYQIERLKENRLTFEMGERWLKHWQSSFSPRLINNILNYHFRGWKRKPLYKLCCSAFCARDQYLLHSFNNRCYKWGYFTRVEEVNIKSLIASRKSDKPTIMWCARYLDWKHPELPIYLASLLKTNGYNFILDLYGDGEKLKATKNLAKKIGVEDVVSFKGAMPNPYILKAMRNHQIFLFTSDKHEGWGAVMNEAMSNGCAVVASDAVGSVPFLINDYENGLIFKSGSIDSLYEKVSYLLDNPSIIRQMSSSAHKTIKEVWSPRQAATNLLALIDNLKNEKETSIKEGPCSKAHPLY